MNKKEFDLICKASEEVGSIGIDLEVGKIGQSEAEERFKKVREELHIGLCKPLSDLLWNTIILGGQLSE